MPIYEYRCESCGHEHDALQKISDAPLTQCPSCDEQALKRLISAPSFRLKGSGWYETDFKSDKEKKRNLAESGDSGGSADKTSSESTTKTSGASESKSSDSGKSEKRPSKSSGSGNEAA